MADCSKTVEFLREWKWMCEAYEECEFCPLNDVTDSSLCDVENIPDEAIDIVQKWSDEHPVMTWLDMLKKSFPNADDVAMVSKTCPGWIFGTGPNMFKTECTGKQEHRCGACWLSEYKEE